MITIRLARTGVKKRPFFHITVADSRMPRDGRFIERVGYFNPIAKGKEIRLKVNQERLDYWLAQGAQLSSRVSSLFEEKDEKFTCGISTSADDKFYFINTSEHTSSEVYFFENSENLGTL